MSQRHRPARPLVVIASIGWFAIGHVAGLAVTHVLFPPWYELGWRAPVGRWLADAGLDQLNALWGMVWLQTPAWITAASLGLAVALSPWRLAHRKWLLFTICAAMGLVTCDIIWSILQGYFYTLFDGEAWGWSVVLLARAWMASSLAPAIVAAALAARLRAGRARATGFDVAAEAHGPSRTTTAGPRDEVST